MPKKKVFPPDISVVTIEWINNKLRDSNMTDYELSLMLSQDRSYLGGIRNGKMKMNKAAKTACLYFFELKKNKLL